MKRGSVLQLLPTGDDKLAASFINMKLVDFLAFSVPGNPRLEKLYYTVVCPQTFFLLCHRIETPGERFNSHPRSDVAWP